MSFCAKTLQGTRQAFENWASNNLFRCKLNIFSLNWQVGDFSTETWFKFPHT